MNYESLFNTFLLHTSRKRYFYLLDVEEGREGKISIGLGSNLHHHHGNYYYTMATEVTYMLSATELLQLSIYII